jgi:hypothetical protein
MAEPDPYAGWPLSNQLQTLALEAELTHLPRSDFGYMGVGWEIPGHDVEVA